MVRSGLFSPMVHESPFAWRAAAMHDVMEEEAAEGASALPRDSGQRGDDAAAAAAAASMVRGMLARSRLNRIE
jgi:hypothetical protein